MWVSSRDCLQRDFLFMVDWCSWLLRTFDRISLLPFVFSRPDNSMKNTHCCYKINNSIAIKLFLACLCSVNSCFVFNSELLS